jgi:hypothetical protein
MGRPGREIGEGKLGTIFWLAVVAAVLYAGFNVGPVYFADFALNDKIGEIGRQPRGLASDEKIYDQLVKYVRDEGLSNYITRESFHVSTLEGHRIVTCQYSRTVNVLPGWSRTINFSNKTDQLLPY